MRTFLITTKDGEHLTIEGDHARYYSGWCLIYSNKPTSAGFRSNDPNIAAAFHQPSKVVNREKQP